MKKILGITRLLGFAAIISAYLIPITLGVVFFKRDLMWTLRRRQGIARALMRLLNIKIHASGVPQDGAFLFVGNHRSYADPAVAACYVAFMPVAKAEVSKWPLVGWGAKITGVVYVKRADKGSRADTRTAVRNALREKKPVLIYPEGTTTDAAETRPFRVGTFQIAAEEGTPVVPITIEYGLPTDAWINADTFIPHFIRCFGKWQTEASLHFGEPIVETDPTLLMEKTQSAIDTQLLVFQSLRMKKD